MSLQQTLKQRAAFATAFGLLILDIHQMLEVQDVTVIKYGTVLEILTSVITADHFHFLNTLPNRKTIVSEIEISPVDEGLLRITITLNIPDALS